MSLFYRTLGNPLKPPLIILHGLWGASDNWIPVAKLLGGDFQVFLPDLRNHGRSLHSSAFGYELLSEDIESFISGLPPGQKPFLAGHSMGGKIVMQLLLKHPGIAGKAAVIDIGPRLYTATPMHLRLLDYMSKSPLQNFQRRQDIHQDIRKHFSSEKEIQILFKNLTKDEQGFSWKANAKAIGNHFPDLSGWPVSTSISPYPSAVLFIKAGHSDYLSAEMSPEIKHYFPAARQITIPDTTHWIHADQPIRLAHALADFFLAP